MATKLRLITKLNSFDDVSKSLQSIEKTFNQLVDSVNKPAESEKKEIEGKTGDLKPLSEGINRASEYSLQVKTKSGWTSPVLKPHYESEWIKLGISSKHKFMHKFNSKMVMFQLFFKTDGTGVKVQNEVANYFKNILGAIYF